jgi:hypothetical protein
MPFADEPFGYSGRRFECGWSERHQSAIDIAERLQKLARRLGAIDAAYERIRPDPGLRTFRPGDLGPIVEMDTAELANQIDARGRCDPPRYPEPVGPTGYRVLYRSDHVRRAPSFLTISVRAGEYGPGRRENRVEVRPDEEGAVWQDPERGIQVLDAMVDVWEPEWASAYALAALPPSEDGEVGSRVRPWLAWTGKPLRPRPIPPFSRPFPAPFPLDGAGPAAETRPWRGGELQIWP